MPAPIDESTSQLIERARAQLQGKAKEAQTDAHRGALAFWLGCPAVSVIAIWFGSSVTQEGKASHAVVTGLATTLVAALVVVSVFQVYRSLVTTSQRTEASLNRLRWLETQARDGLLTESEIRTELLHLMR